MLDLLGGMNMLSIVVNGSALLEAVYTGAPTGVALQQLLHYE